MTHGTPESLRDLAHQHLPSTAAESWLGLLRPGVRLAPAAAADPVAGRLGGCPELPADMEWPVWEGHGPLTFIASVDCAALPVEELDIDLPASGVLSFFFFDGQIDDGDAFVHPGDRDSWAGARVVHVPAGTPCVERKTPDGLDPYPPVPLTAIGGLTAPASWGSADVGTGAFRRALRKHTSSIGHRMGGHADPVQNPVEEEIAAAFLEGGWRNPGLAEAARGWVLLAQFDSDDSARMMWGDCGALYWLIRPEDLAERRFDRAMFTWQCC